MTKMKKYTIEVKVHEDLLPYLERVHAVGKRFSTNPNPPIEDAIIGICNGALATVLINFANMSDEDWEEHVRIADASFKEMFPEQAAEAELRELGLIDETEKE